MSQKSYAGATSTIASNVACPAEKPKASTAASGSTGVAAVKLFNPGQPSRSHTLPAGMRGVTWALCKQFAALIEDADRRRLLQRHARLHRPGATQTVGSVSRRARVGNAWPLL